MFDNVLKNIIVNHENHPAFLLENAVNLLKKESELFSFAARELKDLKESDDNIDKLIYYELLNGILGFPKGMSGGIAPYYINTISKLMNFECLSPLTGDDSEWMDVGTDLFMNTRCFSVWKLKDICYDNNAFIFNDIDSEYPDSCFIGSESSRQITFPYRPTKEYIPVDKHGNWKFKDIPELGKTLLYKGADFTLVGIELKDNEIYLTLLHEKTGAKIQPTKQEFLKTAIRPKECLKH